MRSHGIRMVWISASAGQQDRFHPLLRGQLAKKQVRSKAVDTDVQILERICDPPPSLGERGWGSEGGWSYSDASSSSSTSARISRARSASSG